LIAYALVPHTTILYEAVPAMLVPDNWKEMLMLTITSIVAYGIESLMVHGNTAPTLIERHGMVTIAFVYLPALALVLRRPNDGRVPRWLDETTFRALAPIRRFSRIAPTVSSTSKKLTVIVLAIAAAVATAGWFYQDFTN